MVEALRKLRAERGWADAPANLVGFSGGGTLAVLMAPAVDRLCLVITLASPLDTDEWSARRGYSVMVGSQNPATTTAPLDRRIRQIHFRGADDGVVDPASGAAYMQRNPDAQVTVIPGLAHGAEWADAWSERVRDLRATGQDGCDSELLTGEPADDDPKEGGAVAIW